MDKDELAAKSLFDEMQRKEKLLNEFESLKPSVEKTLFRNLIVFAAFAFLIWMFPELFEEPVLYALLLMIIAVSAETYDANKKIHDRIDLLHRLLKQ